MSDVTEAFEDAFEKAQDEFGKVVLSIGGELIPIDKLVYSHSSDEFVLEVHTQGWIGDAIRQGRCDRTFAVRVASMMREYLDKIERKIERDGNTRPKDMAPQSYDDVIGGLPADLGQLHDALGYSHPRQVKPYGPPE